MSECNKKLASPVPCLDYFGPRSVDGTTPRETCRNYSTDLKNDLIINETMVEEDANNIPGDGTAAKIAAPGPTADATAPTQKSPGKKRPALAPPPSPAPIRQHLEATHDDSSHDLNSLAAHRARLIALLTYIHKYSGDMEKRLDARISHIELTQPIVQTNEISVITINPSVGNAKKKTMATQYTENPANNHQLGGSRSNQNNTSSGSDDDTADALESLREMQVSQMEIKYATMETRYKTKIAFAHAQYQESQRSVACFQSVAAAAFEQASKCQDELAAVKAQMRTAHVTLLQEVATIVHGFKNEVDSLKEVLAAQAVAVPPPVPAEVSSTVEELQSGKFKKY